MTGPAWESLDKTCRAFIGDMRHVLPRLPDNHYHACVTDPPYHLTTNKKGGSGPASDNPNSPAGRSRVTTGFMGKAWDGGSIAFEPETWAAVLRVLRPGAHLIAFGGSRTFHRLACAIEDAGFEIRDTLMWIYGSGFPKSLDVSKAIDKAAGIEREIVGERRFGKTSTGQNSGWNHNSVAATGRQDITAPGTDTAKQWQGWGTALKPAFEPIILARKPLEGTVAANVLKWGCGAMNIDDSRIAATSEHDDKRLNGNGSWGTQNAAKNVYEGGYAGKDVSSSPLGRWPANVIHDGSPEVLERFPNTTSGKEPANGFRRNKPDDEQGIYGGGKGLWNEEGPAGALYGDSGSAARFFYTAKAPKSERPTYVDEHGKSHSHPTVKPLALMEYLCKLVTPNQGTILDPFAGSGTTVEAAFLGHWNCDAIDLEQQHLPLIRSRIDKRCDNEQLFLGLTTSE